MFIIVDFPHPDGPIIAVSSPAEKSPLMLFNRIRLPNRNNGRKCY